MNPSSSSSEPFPSASTSLDACLRLSLSRGGAATLHALRALCASASPDERAAAFAVAVDSNSPHATDAMRVLVAHGARAGACAPVLLRRALIGRRLERLHFLAAHATDAAVAAAVAEGDCFYHALAGGGQAHPTPESPVEVVRALLALRADPNDTRGREGRTALHWACAGRVPVMLSADASSTTSLVAGVEPLVRLLLLQGGATCDARARDRDGRTALDVWRATCADVFRVGRDVDRAADTSPVHELLFAAETRALRAAAYLFFCSRWARDVLSADLRRRIFDALLLHAAGRRPPPRLVAEREARLRAIEGHERVEPPLRMAFLCGQLPLTPAQVRRAAFIATECPEYRAHRARLPLPVLDVHVLRAYRHIARVYDLSLERFAEAAS